MLDSGEADTWRYVHAPGGGGFVLKPRPARHRQREFDPTSAACSTAARTRRKPGFYINTNKTADINKAENDKGYVIPWANDEVLYWLEKLRNWQERYNPIATHRRHGLNWKSKHFGRTPPHPEVLAQRGSACFLFRDPTDSDGDKPLVKSALDVFGTSCWHVWNSAAPRALVKTG
jgi:hypothetical protein